MASIAPIISTISSLFTKSFTNCRVQARLESQFTKAKTRRDMKRRKLVEDYAPIRLRYVAMKRNNILPKEIQDLASQAFDTIPRQSSIRQLTPRCVLTSRGYGTVQRWRLSRIMFRHLADYNHLSGIQRAMW